jgi:methanogenic corrinoid protein MtbC1
VRVREKVRKKWGSMRITKNRLEDKMSEDKQAILSELENSVKNLQEEEAAEAAKKAIAAGISPVEAIEKGLAKGIREVGEKFARKEMFVVELIYAAEIMGGAIKILEPELKKSKEKRNVLAHVVLGTVAGDIHDIGKNLVRIMLEAGGFEVRDIGKDAATDSFVSAAKDMGAEIVGASSLMTTTVGVQKEVVDALRAAGIKAPLMVGGAAVTETWAKEIGAEYSSDAGSAVSLAKNLAGKG